MTHALTAHLGTGDLNAALVTDLTLVAYLLVLTTVTFPVLGRSKDALAEQTVALGLQGAVVDGLGLLDLAVRPLTDQLGRSQTDFNGIERVISHNLESSSCIRVIRQNRRRRSCPLRRNHLLHRLLRLRCRMRRDRCLHLPRR